MDEIYALCPFRAFSGRYNRMMFGYRMREEPFKIKWAQEDVEPQNSPHLRSSVQETNESCVRLLNEQPKLFLQKVHPHVPQSRAQAVDF